MCRSSCRKWFLKTSAKLTRATAARLLDFPSGRLFALVAIQVGIVIFPQISNAQDRIQIALLKPEVATVRRVITLGDVATIESSSRSLKAELAALDLEEFGNGFSVASVSREQILIRLALAGFDADQVTITGAPKVIVSKVEAENATEKLELAFRNQLAIRYQIDPNDLSVRILNRKADIEKQIGFPISLEIVQSLPADLPLGQKSYAVQLSNSNGQASNVRLTARIAVMRDLVIAKQSIAKGEIMTAEHVERVKRPVESRRVRFASFEQVIGKQCEMAINQYDLIKTTAVREAVSGSAPVVRKNSLVNVIVKRGPLEVVLKGARAIDAGNAGEQIALLNPNTRERIIARVIDSATAEVRY